MGSLLRLEVAKADVFLIQVEYNNSVSEQKLKPIIFSQALLFIRSLLGELPGD